MTYYRLLCLQGTGYMATGYNTTNLKELTDEYASYKSNDWCESEEEEGMLKTFNKMSIEDKVNFIENDEFEIEKSETKFNEVDIH